MVRPRRTLRAFTLIELLVVVSIIALLISLLLPSLQRAREQAKEVKCAAQLHDIGISLMSYANGFNRLPPQNTVGTAPVRSERSAVGMWGYAVHKALASYMGGLRESTENEDEYTKTHEVFYCPFVPESQMDFVEELSGPGTGRGIDAAEDIYLHIGYTYFGRLDEVANDPAKLRPWEQEERDIPRKRKEYAGKVTTADDVMMTDTVMLWAGGQKWRINHGAGWQEPFVFGNPPVIPELKGANELFADGHVEQFGPDRFDELVEARNFVQMKRNATLDAGVDSLWW